MVKENKKIIIRKRRETECFPIINRGECWYRTLTKKQKRELAIWYKRYLDAPKTGVIPATPSWIK